MKALIKISVFLLVHLISSQQITFAQDTIPVVTPERTKKAAFSAEPMRATMLAIAFPGLGQLYNRKY